MSDQPNQRKASLFHPAAASAKDPATVETLVDVAPPGRIPSGRHAAATFLQASGSARPDPDACERARAFLEDLVDSADVLLSRRPDLAVEMESDLTDLSMQNAYLVGHALKILLGLGAGSSGKRRSDAALRIRLKSRLSGRVELSVTDDGTFFPADMGVANAADRDMRELVAFVTGRGGSVLVTRLAAPEVAVVGWNRPPIGLSPRVIA
jgi:hypothetical protein